VFSFVSGERRYRVITPKSCANFWVEEQQPPPRPELALRCSAPTQAGTDTLVEVCCTLKNVGDLTEPQAILALPFPADARVRCVSGGPDVSDPSRVTWQFQHLEPGAERTVCANFTPLRPGTVTFAATASAQRAAGVASTRETRVQD